MRRGYSVDEIDNASADSTSLEADDDSGDTQGQTAEAAESPEQSSEALSVEPSGKTRPNSGRPVRTRRGAANSRNRPGGQPSAKSVSVVKPDVAEGRESADLAATVEPANSEVVDQNHEQHEQHAMGS